MPSVPDDHQHDHDDQPSTIETLRLAYPEWDINTGSGLGVVTAELRIPPGGLHYLVAVTPAELGGKIEAATDPELTAFRHRYPAWSVRPAEHGTGYSARYGGKPPGLHGATLAELGGKIDHAPPVRPVT